MRLRYICWVFWLILIVGTFGVFECAMQHYMGDVFATAFTGGLMGVAFCRHQGAKDGVDW